jgi:hypothetical protein
LNMCYLLATEGGIRPPIWHVGADVTIPSYSKTL